MAASFDGTAAAPLAGADAAGGVPALDLAPWRRAAEVILGLATFLVLLELTTLIVALPIGWGMLWLSRAIDSPQRVVASAGDRIVVTSSTRWFRPGRAAGVIADVPAHTIERTRNGLVTDRWQIGPASLVIGRWARERLDRWRTLGAP